jgi:hypothetical protein
MDTGASGMNIIRSDIVDGFTDTRAAIDVISRRINCVDLTNNGKHIGRSSEEVRISFTLDTLKGSEPTTYTEWFYMFDDLQDDMVLGSSFNRIHGFSTYHETLVEWQKGQCPQGLQQPRQRDRITTPAERQDAAIHELKRSRVDVTACTKKPGTGVPIIRRPQGHGVQHLGVGCASEQLVLESQLEGAFADRQSCFGVQDQGGDVFMRDFKADSL